MYINIQYIIHTYMHSCVQYEFEGVVPFRMRYPECLRNEAVATTELLPQLAKHSNSQPCLIGIHNVWQNLERLSP
jgi:hypothetical protein